MNELLKSLEKAKKLHTEVWKDESPPQDNQEFQASVVLSRLQTTVQDLIADHVPLYIIELSLFYFWFRMATLSCNLDESIFERHINDMSIRDHVVHMIQNVHIEDEGATDTMEKLGNEIQIMRNMMREALQIPITDTEKETYAKLCNQRIWEITGKCLKEMIQPGTVETGLLYFWYRSWNILTDESEDRFQKLERHWELVNEEAHHLVRGLS